MPTSFYIEINDELKNIKGAQGVCDIFYSILKAMYKIHPDETDRLDGSTLGFLTSVGAVYSPEQCHKGEKGQRWWQIKMSSFYTTNRIFGGIPSCFVINENRETSVEIKLGERVAQKFKEMDDNLVKLGEDIISFWDESNISDPYFVTEITFKSSHKKLELLKFKQDLEKIFKKYYKIQD